MSTAPLLEPAEFGAYLRDLRRRVGMTQRDLAAAVGFSESQISRLEKGQRLPDVSMVAHRFVPALGLGEEPRLAVQLVDLAAAVRGEKPLKRLTVQHEVRQALMAVEAEDRRLLPAPPTPLLGREQDVDQLVKRMLGHSGRLITVVGPPGIGKSRLALAVAQRLAVVYRDGAAFIPLAAIDDPSLVGTAVAGELELPDGDGKSSKARLINHLRRKESLLLLDNFEQVIEAAPLVAELLANCPELHVLVTSRERLHLRAEQRFAVQPLDAATAVDLFVQSVRAADPEFRLTEENGPVIEAICAQLDWLPLAIELSAARIELAPPSTLLAQLASGRLDLLDDAARDRAPDHTTLRAAIWRSYSLLSTTEQSLYRSLSVFIGGFDATAVEALGFDSSALQRLHGKSLVQGGTSTSGARRFLLLDTLREFAVERLTEQGDEERARFRHADYFLGVARQMQQTSGGDVKQRWLDRLDAEIYNIRAALRFFIDRDRAKALQMTGDLREFWYIRGYNTEGRRWLAEAIAGQTSESREFAHALLAAGQLAMAQSDYDEARRLAERSLDLFRRLGDRREVALALHLMGWIARETELHEEAYSRFSESLRILREVDEKSHLIQVLTSLAALLGASGGNVAERRAYLKECIDVARNSDDDEALAYVLARQGTLEMVDGHYALADSMLWEAASLFHNMGFKREEAWALEELGEAYLLLGDVNAAAAHFDAARTLFTGLGEQLGLMLLEHHDGQIARRRGRLAEASERYVRSLNHFSAMNHRKMVSRCLAGLAGVATLQGETRRAATLWGAVYSLLDALPPFLPPGETDEYQRLLEMVRTSLDQDLFEQRWQAASAAPLAQVVAFALADEPDVVGLEAVDSNALVPRCG